VSTDSDSGASAVTVVIPKAEVPSKIVEEDDLVAPVPEVEQKPISSPLLRCLFGHADQGDPCKCDFCTLEFAAHPQFRRLKGNGRDFLPSIRDPEGHELEVKASDVVGECKRLCPKYSEVLLEIQDICRSFSGRNSLLQHLLANPDCEASGFSEVDFGQDSAPVGHVVDPIREEQGESMVVSGLRNPDGHSLESAVPTPPDSSFYALDGGIYGVESRRDELWRANFRHLPYANAVEGLRRGARLEEFICSMNQTGAAYEGPYAGWAKYLASQYTSTQFDRFYTRVKENRPVVNKAAELLQRPVLICEMLLSATTPQKSWRDVAVGWGRQAIQSTFAATYAYRAVSKFLASTVHSAFNSSTVDYVFQTAYQVANAVDGPRRAAVSVYDWLMHSPSQVERILVCPHILEIVFAEKPKLDVEEAEAAVARMFVRCSELAIPDNYYSEIVAGTQLMAGVEATVRDFRNRTSAWRVRPGGLVHYTQVARSHSTRSEPVTGSGVGLRGRCPS